MGIRSLTLQKAVANPTLTFTENEDAVFAEDGMAVANGVHLICTSHGSPIDRKQITFKARPSMYDAKTGSFSKGKSGISVVRPHVLADGKVSFLTVRVELEVHPEAEQADINEVVNHAVELMLDDEYRNFWRYGAKS